MSSGHPSREAQTISVADQTVSYGPVRVRGSLKPFYLVMTILSAIVSWAIAAQFLLSGEASIAAFFQQCFATPVSTLLSSDILISALVFLFFVRQALIRLKAPRQWFFVYIITTFSIGLCFPLSLFLYQRETWLTQNAPQSV